MQLTQQQVQQLIDTGKKRGLQGQDILTSLSQKGYTFPGSEQVKQIQPLIQPVAEEKSTFLDRQKETIGNVSERIVDIQQDPTKSGLSKGIGTTAEAFSAVSGTAYNALPEPGRKAVDFIGRKIGKGVEEVTNWLLERPKLGQLITEAAMSGETGRLEQVLQDVGGLGVIAGEIAGAGEGAVGVQKAFTKGIPVIKSTTNTIANTTRDAIESIGKTFNSATTNNPLSRTNKIDTPESVFETAKSRGFAPEDAKVFSDFEVPDKAVGKQMLELSEGIAEGKIDITKGKRPVDFIGEGVVSDIKSLEKIQSQIGKKVDEVATSLKGQIVDTKPLIESVNRKLNEFGITVKGNKISFKDSDFALTKSVQNDIKDAIDFINSPKKDAFAVHRIKKTLDTLIKPTKAGEGLQGEAKRLIQDLRREVDNFLDGKFTDYDAVNTQYKDIFELLDEGRTVLGKELVDTKVSQQMRGLFSNRGNRGIIRDYLAKLDSVRGQYKLPERGSLARQTYLAEKLEDIYGTQAITGLRGQTERAIKGTQAVIEGLRDPIKGIGNVAGTAVEALARQRPQDRINFLKELLSK